MTADPMDTEIVPRRVLIPYKQRKHFLKLHASKKRFQFVVAHRRAGKSVAIVNHIIRKALENPRPFPVPRYGYVGPSFAQAKDLVWNYFKHYTAPLNIPDEGLDIGKSEGELQLKLPNGALVNLYGGAGAYERMRGLYFDGIALDEYPMLNSSVFSTVVRPCLADYRGWGIVSGTSNGDDHFHALKKRAEREPDRWEIHVIPVTETDALDPDEVLEMTSDMTPEEYAREMLCSFDAPIEGSYYGEIMNELELEGSICPVPYDPAAKVYTWWDLGIDDEMCIWFVQRIGREFHIIDYYANTGKALDFYARVIKDKGYFLGGHILPHDVKARELGTGKSRYEVLLSLLDDVYVVPLHKIEDGIEATKAVLRMSKFDTERTTAGRASMKNYHRSKMGRPVHNWASHGADAFRTGAMGLNYMDISGSSNIVNLNGPLRRKLRRVRN